MLTVLVSPFVGIASELSYACRSLDDSVNYWFAERGHGPYMTRLVKLVPVAGAVALAVGLAA